MDCDVAREALSARVDGEREPIPAARVDEHVAGCAACRQWQAAVIEQTQLIRRLAGRAQVAAVRTPPDVATGPARRAAVGWPRWALGAVGVVQIGLAIAQAAGAHPGLPHTAAGHVLNESTAWSGALGAGMLAAAIRPAAAAGLGWVLAAFLVLLAGYVGLDAAAGRVTLDRALTHLPVLAGTVLTLVVWRAARRGEPDPDHTHARLADDIVLPDHAVRGRRRRLRSTDGSAA